MKFVGVSPCQCSSGLSSSPSRAGPSTWLATSSLALTRASTLSSRRLISAPRLTEWMPFVVQMWCRSSGPLDRQALGGDGLAVKLVPDRRTVGLAP